MSSDATERFCDVIGCDGPPVRDYLDARGPRSFAFRICVRHFEQLATGPEPVIVESQVEAGRVIYGQPGLLLE